MTVSFAFIKTFFLQCLDFLQPPICALCQRRLPEDQPETPVCPRCQRRLLPFTPTSPIFTAAVFHIGPARHLVHQFKYQKQEYLATFMAMKIAEAFRANRPAPAVDFIVPVPLWSARQRERGYNQAELIANELSKILNIPTAAKSLYRIRKTEIQTHLNREQRKQNVKGAFAMSKNSARRELLHGKQVLLVDDVCTTGATLKECAETLIAQAGVGHIAYAVFARAAMDTANDQRLSVRLENIARR